MPHENISKVIKYHLIVKRNVVNRKRKQEEEEEEEMGQRSLESGVKLGEERKQINLQLYFNRLKRK